MVTTGGARMIEHRRPLAALAILAATLAVVAYAWRRLCDWHDLDDPQAWTVAPPEPGGGL